MFDRRIAGYGLFLIVIALTSGVAAEAPGPGKAGASKKAPGTPGKPGPSQQAPSPAAASPSAEQVARAKRDFGDVAAVLLSPRCRNCHPRQDRPLQRDEGIPHRMNISRRSPEAGLPCTACHRDSNSTVQGGPPGVANWHMPPAETPMIFEGRTPTELCQQLKDPEQTGGRDLDDLIEHVRSDALVLWGWNPGEGRTRPPIAHDVFVDKVERWVRAGAPCP